MLFKDDTVEGAIAKALGKEEDPNAETRKRCSALAARVGPIEAQFSQLMQALEKLERELASTEQDESQALARLSQMAHQFVERGRQVRGTLSALQAMARGEFGPQMLRVMNAIIAFTQETRGLADEANGLATVPGEGNLQSTIAELVRMCVPVSQAMTQLRDEFERSGCANLPAPTTVTGMN